MTNSKLEEGDAENNYDKAFLFIYTVCRWGNEVNSEKVLELRYFVCDKICKLQIHIDIV